MKIKCEHNVSRLQEKYAENITESCLKTIALDIWLSFSCLLGTIEYNYSVIFVSVEFIFDFQSIIHGHLMMNFCLQYTSVVDPNNSEDIFLG